MKSNAYRSGEMNVAKSLWNFASTASILQNKFTGVTYSR